MEKTMRIIAVSDTHSSSEQLEKIIKNKVKGDIFIHAGDFTRYGSEIHFKNFINLLKQL